MYYLNIDISAITDMGKEFESALKAATEEAASNLADLMHAHAVELASQKLNSRRKKFVEALSTTVEGGVHILNLAEHAIWIDDGMPEHSMLENLLKSPKAKRAKDGSSYLVVPFDHGPGKGPTNSTPDQQNLVAAIKTEMKKKKIPWAKTETDSSGKPKFGKLHSFNVPTPNSSGGGRGQGWGPAGKPKQGPNPSQAHSQSKKTQGGGGTQFLHGVAIYQTPDGAGGAKRSVMTFRVASSKHGGDRWKHPGLEGTHIMDETVKWAMEEIEKEIGPKIVESILAKL